jgi:hypothetical protein
MSVRSIVKTIESVASQISKQAGIQHGAKSSSVETIVSCYGDFFTSLAYAGFFFPEMRIVDGVPFARFPTATEETPLDCVHVDLLHHNQASGRTPEIMNALGHVLAEVWSHNLKVNSLPGKFVYGNSGGFDVTYKP